LWIFVWIITYFFLGIPFFSHLGHAKGFTSVFYNFQQGKFC